ncbi:hypothetical protein [Bilophila sp.]|uniref:hypothetical protein n=1 Tax=Bilophila sp. TaxID=1929485 RepID=UPI003076A864
MIIFLTLRILNRLKPTKKRREKLPAFFALAASQKMADAFSLKSQRDKQQNVLAVGSANGKTG